MLKLEDCIKGFENDKVEIDKKEAVEKGCYELKTIIPGDPLFAEASSILSPILGSIPQITLSFCLREDTSYLENGKIDTYAEIGFDGLKIKTSAGQNAVKIHDYEGYAKNAAFTKALDDAYASIIALFNKGLATPIYAKPNPMFFDSMRISACYDSANKGAAAISKIEVSLIQIGAAISRYVLIPHIKGEIGPALTADVVTDKNGYVLFENLHSNLPNCIGNIDIEFFADVKHVRVDPVIPASKARTLSDIKDEYLKYIESVQAVISSLMTDDPKKQSAKKKK
jgi:hypothetical protein